MNSLSLLFMSALGMASAQHIMQPVPQPSHYETSQTDASSRKVCEYVIDGEVRVDDFCMKQLAMRTYLDTKPR